MKVKKAFIPVAGFGTRFLPATKAVPKEMLPIVDVPALQYVVQEAVDSGIKDILILISPQKKCIIDYFTKKPDLEYFLKNSSNQAALNAVRSIGKGATVQFAVQDEMKGTACALNYAAKWCEKEPFAVLFGDDVFLADKPVTLQLSEAYEMLDRPVLGVQRVTEEVARRCGVISVGRAKGNVMEVKKIDEKPTGELASDFASLGRFIVTPDVFDVVERTPVNAKGEKDLTETLSLMARETGVFACDFSGKRFDIGNKLGFILANLEFGLRNPETSAGLADYLRNRINE